MAAGLGFKTFVTGEVLTSADTNGYLMQGVNVFANAAARTAAITSPQEGQMSYLKDTDLTEYYSGSAWSSISGGGITLLSTTSLTGATTTISSISQAYNSLMLVMYGVTAAGNGIMRLAPNGTTNISTYSNVSANGATMTTSSVQAGYINFGATGWDGSNANNSTTLIFNNYTSSANYKPFTSYGYARNSSGADSSWNLSGAVVSNTAISSLVLSQAGGNLSAGTALLYGVK
jgi:hypothetical protein